MGVVLAGTMATIALWGGAAAASGSLYQGPPPRPGPDILYRPLGAGAAARERRHLAREADPDLRHERLPPGRVPLPGLPLRRPRRPRRESRPGRPPLRRGHLLATQRHLHLSDQPGLREQRRRPGRAPGQATPQRDRFPDHPEHSQGPLLGCDHDRNRRRPAAPALPPRGERAHAGGALPHRPRLAADVVRTRDSQPIRPSPAGVDRPGAAPDRGPRLAPRLGSRPSAPFALPPASGSGTRRPVGISCRGMPPPPPGREAPPGSPLPPPSSTPPSASASPGSTPFLPTACSTTRPGGATASRATRWPTATSGSLPRHGRLRQARGRGHRQPPRRARGCAARRAPWTGSSPAISRPSRAPTTRSRAAAPNDCQGELPRAASALCDLRSQGTRSAGRLRHDAAAPLARRQLQPVRR